MKKNYVVMAVSLLFFMVVASGDSYAQNRKGAFTVTPSIGGYVFEGNQAINNDIVYGIGLGYNVTERIGLEAVFNYVDTDAQARNTEPDIDVYVYHLDFLYHFMPDSDVVPYLAVGAGAIDIDPDNGSDDTNVMANGGGGVKAFLTENIALRGDVRYIRDLEDDYNNFRYTLGLLVQLGGKEKAPELPADSDGDGVTDDMDKCPDTPAGVKVDSDGCPLDSDGDGVPDYLDKCPDTPAGVKVDSDGCPLDSDGDGVPDYLDKCPGTPRGAPVNSVGCPLDSDGDGVYDYLDKCPDTPRGIKVDAKGCPIPIKEEVSIELRVKFAFDSDVVESVFEDHIQKVANFLKAYPDTIAEIDGHTDSVGSEKYNLALSQRRAENVMKHLISKGIDPSRMKAVGFGESMPVADNNTEEGRRKNRRVVAVIKTIITKQ